MAIKEEFVITYLDLLQELEKEKPDILLIDVREPTEIAKDGQIPKAINIKVTDVKEFEKLSEESFKDKYGIPKPAKDTKMIFSCFSGKRAENAAKQMQQQGYTQVYLYRGSFKEWNEKQKPERQAFIIKYEQLLEDQKKSDVLIVDVREPEELAETGEISESINIRSTDVVKEFKELSEESFKDKYGKPKPTKDTKIIFSCHTGNRSERVQNQMQDLGYKQVYNFEGGWKEWNREEKKKKENDSGTQKGN
ncbi:Heat shock protein 67B2 [Trachymyrmex zeteki]|uniref:Sulfurtransferase n=2 Tax=Mycetomoellerius zeteki TaxID=64791 RepID=A0A151WIY4_9HYME|nr:Heat shock protein 67B2 [Trachymyrmex zeteki]